MSNSDFKKFYTDDEFLNYIKMKLPIEDINKTNYNGNYILSWACAKDKLDIVKYLLENGADVNIVGVNGYTPLHFANANGHFTIVDLLEKKGANQDAKDKDGRTPFQHFVSYAVGDPSLICK
jgi:ankyrin repeat protein